MTGNKGVLLGSSGVLIGKEATGNCSIEIVSNTGGISYIDFSVPNSDFQGRILFNNSSNVMTFHSSANTAARMTIQANGTVNIPTLTGTSK